MKKIITSTAILIITPLLSFVGILIVGTLIGNIINPINHNHYECVCDDSPVLSEPQAYVIGLIFFALIMTGIYFFIRALKLPKPQNGIALTTLSIINALACLMAIQAFTTTISG